MRIFLSISSMIALTMFAPHMVFAAELYFAPPLKSVQIGEEVAIDVYLDTEAKAINAVEGEVAIAGEASMASFSRIRDGDSIIGAWVVKANVNDGARVTFSGIIPRGITTTKGKIMTLYLISKHVGIVELTVMGNVYEDKASGSPLPMPSMSVAIPVTPWSSDTAIPTTAVGNENDVSPPDGIRAIIAQNEQMFDGRPFVIIDAKDSQSGIATYELLEVSRPYTTSDLLNDRTLPWREIENPAPLLYPLESTFSYVRVTDREGNATVVSVSRPAQLSTEKTPYSFDKWLLSAILIIAAGFLLWLWRQQRRHHAP